MDAYKLLQSYCLVEKNISNFFVLLSRSNVWSLKGKSGACGARACDNPRFLRLRFAFSFLPP